MLVGCVGEGGKRREEVITYVDVVNVLRLHLAVGLGHGGLAALEGYGPVHEVEVEIVGA